MADTTKPRRSAKPTDPEALAFGVITNALADLDTEAVHRTLDHVAKRHGFYVVHELPLAELQSGAQVGSDPDISEWDRAPGADAQVHQG